MTAFRIGHGFDVHALVDGRDCIIGGVHIPHPQGRHVVALLQEKGYAVGNIDATVICEAPRLGPHTQQMREHIAADCEVAPDAINVKATTTEKLGFTGRGEGIAAEAVCLIVANS